MRKTSEKKAAGRGAAIVFVLAAGAGGALAQAPTAAGAIEVSGVFGAAGNIPSVSGQLSAALNEVSPGFTVSDGSEFKWYVGGTAGYAITKNLLFVFGTDYNHIGSSNITYGSGVSKTTISAGYSLTDFTGGIHYQLPVRSSRFVPYLSAGLGGVRQGVSASSSGTSLGGSETDFTVNAGGGLRIYLSKGWGIRPEISVVRIPGQTYFRYGAGFFWQSKQE
jgi:hypothetical protein